MGGRLIRIATAGAVALAIGAPAANATSVYWTGDFRLGSDVYVKDTTGEANDLTIVGSDGQDNRARVVDVYDRSATLDDGGKPQVEPGVCSGDFFYCVVPCRIESPSHARCVIDDGYANVPRTIHPLDSEYWPAFDATHVDVGTGQDRVVSARGLIEHTVSIDGGDGGNRYTFLGNGGVNASDNDRVVFRGGKGGATIWGGGVTVEAVDGVKQSFSCWHRDPPPKLYFDPLDTVSNGPYCPAPVLPPKLPAL